MPPDYDINGSMALLKDLCAVSASMLKTQHGRPVHFESIFEFLEDFVHTHGYKIEKWASESTESMSVNLNDKEAARLLENLMLGTITATQASLGSVWTIPKEQEEGQSAFERKPSPAHAKRSRTMPCFLFAATSGAWNRSWRRYTSSPGGHLCGSLFKRHRSRHCFERNNASHCNGKCPYSGMISPAYSGMISTSLFCSSTHVLG
jgi:hypothetical protein